MLFPNASIVPEDVDTQRSTLRRRVKTQTKRRQSHVKAGTVPESKNARPQGRPVASFRSLDFFYTNMHAYFKGILFHYY